MGFLFKVRIHRYSVTFLLTELDQLEQLLSARHAFRTVSCQKTTIDYLPVLFKDFQCHLDFCIVGLLGLHLA